MYLTTARNLCGFPSAIVDTTQGIPTSKVLPGGLPSQAVGGDASPLIVLDEKVEPFGPGVLTSSGSTMAGGSRDRCLRTRGVRCGATLDAFDMVRVRIGEDSVEEACAAGTFGTGGTAFGRRLTVALGVTRWLAEAVVLTDAAVAVERTELTEPGRSGFGEGLADEVRAVALVVLSRAGGLAVKDDVASLAVPSEPGG